MKVRIVKVQHLSYTHYETEKYWYGVWVFDCAFANLTQAEAYVAKQSKPKREVIQEYELSDDSIMRKSQQEL